MRSVVMRMNINEMPTACGPCKLSCTAICKEWTKVDRKEIGRTKSPNCPILAILPEGHGRLADADALIKRIEISKAACEAWTTEARTENGKNIGTGAIKAFQISLLAINEIPIIVPAEEERSET